MVAAGILFFAISAADALTFALVARLVPAAIPQLEMNPVIVAVYTVAGPTGTFLAKLAIAGLVPAALIAAYSLRPRADRRLGIILLTAGAAITTLGVLGNTQALLELLTALAGG